ncbi:hypothetical protein XFF6991_420073 [Xanthomonas phaseoli pv. phaseoli]|uniref:Uncharacterized protein n=1 Tax=Xanthomonas campestris pv. phaseoli TaxID=317013 RepID=A0A7Z7NHI6_XANCH|nr:hypothetical protein XFF6991_420073 [Xanthomonas phaseoli pv. phaseoli]
MGGPSLDAPSGAVQAARRHAFGTTMCPALRAPPYCSPDCRFADRVAGIRRARGEWADG